MHTNKFDLALTVLGCVSQAPVNCPVTAQQLSRLTGGCVTHIEQVIRPLRVSGYLRAVRGPGGGYWPTSKITKASVGDIFKLFIKNSVGHKRSSGSTSSEGQAAVSLGVQMGKLELDFLKTYPLAKVIRRRPPCLRWHLALEFGHT